MPTKLTIDGFWDIETENWDTFVVGGLLDENGFRHSTDEDEFFDWLASAQGTYWSWNGGLFDMLWLLEVARRKGVNSDIALAGTRVSRCRIGKATHRDAVCLIPSSLAKAAPMASMELDKDTGLPCSCTRFCGGYCSIKRDMAPHMLRSLVSYLELDCIAGKRILESVFSEADRCDYHLTGTIGGSAYKTAREMLLLRDTDWAWPEYNFAREAYYGGRTEVFRPSASQAYAYDINSAYPAALANTGIPVGERALCDDKEATKAFELERPGLYQARVHVPDMFVPPLPVRTGMRIAYPIGDILGTWPLPELLEAQSLGCFVEPTAALVWQDTDRLIEPFMRHVWQHRNEYESGPWRQWHKLFANSLTGKFAERPEKERVLLHPTNDSVKTCSGGKCECRAPELCRRKRCCDAVCRSTCNRWRMLDRSGHLWGAPFQRISKCAHVHWSAYLTSITRVQLAAQLRADSVGGASAVYCDTDSVYATETRTKDIGPELGQWGSDGLVTDFVAEAPKAYCYTDADGSRVVRCKGLASITPETYDQYIRGEPVTIERGVKGLRSAAKDGSLFVRKRISRASRSDGIHYGGRILRDDGRTYPQTLEELSAKER